MWPWKKRPRPTRPHHQESPIVEGMPKIDAPSILVPMPDAALEHLALSSVTERPTTTPALEARIDTLPALQSHVYYVYAASSSQPSISWVPRSSVAIGARQVARNASAFISFSKRDQKFADKLIADLGSNGVRYWYFPVHQTIGADPSVEIEEAIHGHDKTVVILSKHSLESSWVAKEVRMTQEKERLQGRKALLPIRLDDTAMNVKSGWMVDIKRGHTVGDFRGWRNHVTYQMALDQLLRALRVGP